LSEDGLAAIAMLDTYRRMSNGDALQSILGSSDTEKLLSSQHRQK